MQSHHEKQRMSNMMLSADSMNQTHNSAEMSAVPEYASAVGAATRATITVDEILEAHYRDFCPDQDVTLFITFLFLAVKM